MFYSKNPTTQDRMILQQRRPRLKEDYGTGHKSNEV
jgi:hypothetical protein